MEINQAWEDLVLRIFKKNGGEWVSSRDSGIATWPFYGFQESPLPFLSTPLSHGFTHIVPASLKAMDGEFMATAGAAVEVGTLEEYSQFKSCQTVFLKGAYWHNQKTLETWLSQEDKPQRINLGWDPWVLGLHQGRMSRWSDDKFPIHIFKDKPASGIQAFLLSSELFSLAGGSGVHELAILLASAMQCMDFFEDRLSPKELASHMAFQLVADTDPLWTAAKVQSFKQLWQRVLELMSIGKGDTPETPVYLCPSVSHFSTREPWNNLVKLTLMQAGGFFGGASGFRHYPFDNFSREPKEEGRLSRNIGLILQSESGLGFVHNPLEGAGVVDHWVRQLCEKAWSVFQEIDKKGGLVSVLQSGWLQGEIEDHRLEIQKGINQGHITLVGASRYVGLEKLSQHHPFADKNKTVGIEDWWDQRSAVSDLKKEFRVKPLVPYQWTRVYEDFQMESDRAHGVQGERPFVYVYCENQKGQGEKISRLKDLLAVAGVSTKIEKDLFKMETNVACCLGSDPDADHWPATVESLKNLGYRRILWFGEREHKCFDGHWSPKIGLEELCRDVHEGLGVSK